MKSSFACFRSFILLLGLSLVLLTPAPARAQNANDGFDPNADGLVDAVAVQADGKLLVGGTFAQIAGQSRARLARLLVDGSLDPDFASTVVNAEIDAIAVQADGRILIAGDFSQVGAFARNRIARLNADGSVDARSTRMRMTPSVRWPCRPTVGS